MILDVHNLKPVPVIYVYMFREVYVSVDMKIDGNRDRECDEREKERYILLCKTKLFGCYLRTVKVSQT